MQVVFRVYAILASMLRVIIRSLCLPALLGIIFTPSGHLYAQETLTFSVHDAVLQAVKNNLGLNVERYNPVIASQDILIEKGAFDPAASLSVNKSFSKALSPTEVDNNRQISFDVDFALSGKIETATQYKLELTHQRLFGDSVFLRINPYHFSGLTLTLTQPVLKNFGKEIQTSKIKAAEKNVLLADYELSKKAEDLVSETVKAFYDVLLAQESLSISRFSLSLGEKILHEVQRKVAAGFLAPVDVFNAEAEVAKREELVIRVDNALKNASDSLRRLLGLNDWHKEMRLIKPDISAEHPPSLESSLRDAEQNRNELKQAIVELEKKKLFMHYSKNQRLPEVDVVVAGGVTGLADTTSSSFERAYHGIEKNWKVGILLQMPLFDMEAKGRYLKARYEEAQAEEALKDLKEKIAFEVRQAWRGISLSLKTIEASKKTRIASEKKLWAEERRFQEGFSTLNDVLKFQEDYIKSLLNEKKTEYDYRISVAELEKTKGTLLMYFDIPVAASEQIAAHSLSSTTKNAYP